jgi:HNH endonuclease
MIWYFQSRVGKNKMQLPLFNGKIALVDDEFSYLSEWKWQQDTQGYPSRGGSVSGKKCHIRLHTIIMGPSPPGLVTDHINGNKLDNRQANLRFCSRTLNQLNRSKLSVCRHRLLNSWRIRYKINRKEIFTHAFKDKSAALSVAALLKGSLMYFELSAATLHQTPGGNQQVTPAF